MRGWAVTETCTELRDRVVASLSTTSAANGKLIERNCGGWQLQKCSRLFSSAGTTGLIEGTLQGYCYSINSNQLSVCVNSSDCNSTHANKRHKQLLASGWIMQTSLQEKMLTNSQYPLINYNQPLFIKCTLLYCMYTQLREQMENICTYILYSRMCSVIVPVPVTVQCVSSYQFSLYTFVLFVLSGT